ncbi:multiple sugar transport system permease protein/raffinose/stachyose/melibiose transport system permease protein [Paenibacillus catalpae]|uniref:Multiple sugar transport system permease protein/raffinose/stachyose/melibiose transport system permease protein n=1 Tax=Paenibacillus catalpae TaxID=1045775 RepID=A0A1I2ADF0_9BACL|nr:sugar ABC transporter permease [Paenibacillus catalpae]SFE41849.1 multiple sugar transport system permease protein/raffinose/stachyose/melibiose transport system permease protein [Paenibacillus catalpae]
MQTNLRQKWKINGIWLLFVLPALLFYLIFLLLPTLSATYYSLTDWDGVTSTFIGLDNFRAMFQDRLILASFRNTLQYTVSITIVQNGLGLLAALLLVRAFRGVNALRTMFFMPHIFSGLVMGYVWGFILEPNIGALNNVLEFLHLDALKMSWLGDPSVARWMIVFVSSWQNLGFSMVIYIAGLQGVPRDLYEYSDVEGASRWRKFASITFPLIAPSFTINMILCLIGNLKLFDQIYSLTGGGPGFATESIASTIYKVGFYNGIEWGYGSALSIVLFLCILLLSVTMVTLLRRREVEM